MYYLALITWLSPLLGGLVAGLACRLLSKRQVHTITIAAMFIASATCLAMLILHFQSEQQSLEYLIYHWVDFGEVQFEVGLLLDTLSLTMATVVVFISLLVHIYTIAYMHEEPTSSYNRFFCYISLFTFAMLSLVLANNFLQLFFGWEGVGVISYLLIGFWFKKPTASSANLKAFLLNRVGDFGFLLGIALVAQACSSLNYGDVFASKDSILAMTGYFDGQLSFVALTCLLLFVGAMGKSAQVPLHAWLPDSMEGPTPISALIHAATMVTAGIFMVARMSPLFELAPLALEVVMVVGTLTAFALGLVGLVQNDIKRVVAYSTLSQLGYMTAALGFSAYHIAIFHLMTHAFFKALLFLAAGSVIVALHHQQDMRKMGGLKKYLPITYFTTLIGSLALIGFPGFSGFYSKDLIIELARQDSWLASTCHSLLLAGVFVTALYSFRMFFLVFHGKEKFTPDPKHPIKESPWAITVPLVILAVFSIFFGVFTVDWFLQDPSMGGAIFIAPEHAVATTYTWWSLIQHAWVGLPLYFALAGVFVAWFYFSGRGNLETIGNIFRHPIEILKKKYGFDHFYMVLVPRWTLVFAQGCSRYLDQILIDRYSVTNTAKNIFNLSKLIKKVQSGYLYDYIFVMLLAMVILWVTDFYLA